MRKNTKKGFTLVELLVVVAIVAILATVSVVAYLSFTEKAKQSNDEVLVKQLNTVLQADEVNNGKPNTMHDAVNILGSHGFVVEKLTPTSGKNEFVYDITTNRFEVWKVEAVTSGEANSNKWVVVKEEDRLNEITAKYSVYLSSVFTESGTPDNKLTVQNGFDAGLISTAFDVTYNNTVANKSTVMHTNAGNLTLNGSETDNVTHFGEASRVDVNKVGMNSYHVNGKVSQINLKYGRVAIEVKAEVSEVLVPQGADVTKVKINISSKVNKIPTIVNGTSGILDVKDENNNVVNDLKELKATYVSNENDLEYALWPLKGNPSEYIIFKNDILLKNNRINVIKDVIIDGRGFMLKGHRDGSEEQLKDETVITLNQENNIRYNAIIRNLIIEGTSTKDKNLTIGVCHFVNNLTLENVSVKNIATNGAAIGVYANLNMPKININMKNCKIEASKSGYCMRLQRLSNLNMDNVIMTGFNSINANSNSNGSICNIKNSKLRNENAKDGEANAFGCIVTYATNFVVNLENTYINSISTGENCFQYALLSHTSNPSVSRNLAGIKLNVSNGSIIEGQLLGLIGTAKLNWNVNITDSKLTINPEKPKFRDIDGFVPSTHKVLKDGIYYNVLPK